MRSNIKITIIIPIYKVEHYIERCVRSLMEQTMAEGLEFLFINDCSPDRSMEILRRVISEYPARQSQIRIIDNVRNLGVSETRKLGVREAKGEYIGWCDADDWYEKDALQQLWAKSSDGTMDMVVADYFEDYETEIKRVTMKQQTTPSDCFINMRLGFTFPGSLWQHICRRSIVEKSINQIYNVSYAEDIYTIILETFYAKSIAYTNTALYHHTNENQGSLLHNIGYKPEDWQAQKRNLEIVSNILCSADEKFHVPCSCLKLFFKEKFRSAFPSLRSYYKEFRDAYRDINDINFTPKSKRLKTYLVYNFYPLFWWYNRKTWKK